VGRRNQDIHIADAGICQWELNELTVDLTIQRLNLNIPVQTCQFADLISGLAAVKTMTQIVPRSFPSKNHRRTTIHRLDFMRHNAHLSKKKKVTDLVMP
jgi:hypothetical protein